MSGRSSHHRKSHSYHRSSDSEDDRPTTSGEYRRFCQEMTHNLKRKRREYQDLEDKIDREKRETKKAKQDTQDLWKIYYTLQQELQQSYERNAKLQSEKATVDAELEARRKKEDENPIGSSDPTKMKQALFEMQKQKLEMQQKFNDIVLENKKLKEKEQTYEPRLREFDNLKEKISAAQRELLEVSSGMHSLTSNLNSVSVSQEDVDKHRRWNSVLMLEVQQKTRQLTRLQNVVDSETAHPWLTNLNQKLSQSTSDFPDDSKVVEYTKVLLKQLDDPDRVQLDMSMMSIICEYMSQYYTEKLLLSQKIVSESDEIDKESPSDTVEDVFSA